MSAPPGTPSETWHGFRGLSGHPQVPQEREREWLPTGPRTGDRDVTVLLSEKASPQTKGQMLSVTRRCGHATGGEQGSTGSEGAEGQDGGDGLQSPALTQEYTPGPSGSYHRKNGVLTRIGSTPWVCDRPKALDCHVHLKTTNKEELINIRKKSEKAQSGWTWGPLHQPVLRSLHSAVTTHFNTHPLGCTAPGQGVPRVPSARGLLVRGEGWTAGPAAREEGPSPGAPSCHCCTLRLQNARRGPNPVTGSLTDRRNWPDRFSAQCGQPGTKDIRNLLV